MEVSSDQRINELCKQVIETNTPLDQIQMSETGDEREKLIVAVRAKVAELFSKKERAVDYWEKKLRKIRGDFGMEGYHETSLPNIPAPLFPQEKRRSSF